MATRRQKLGDLTRSGQTYWLMGRYDEAAADLSRVIEFDPGDAWAIAARGETYRLMGLYDEALADLSRAIELDPRRVWPVARRSRVYQEMERYDEALADLNHVIELDPGDAWAIAARGGTYRLMGFYAGALADLNRAIELDPSLDWALAARGETYRLMGLHDEALADLNRAIELDPGDAWAIAARGETYRLMGLHPEAVADFSRAIELDPRRVWPVARRSRVYREMERYDEALADLNHVIELDPGDAWALAARGGTYRLMGFYAGALADLNRAIELDPSLDWALAARGETYRLMGLHDEALADLNRAIELDPGDAWAIAARGETYRLMGLHPEAVADFSRAIELDPRRVWPVARRSRVYREMGLFDGAVADLNRAVELDPGAAWLVAARGETYRLMGLCDQAIADFSRAIELDPRRVWPVARRSRVYREMGLFDGAVADLNRAVELDPGAAWLVAARGETYRLMGLYDEALADLNRAVELDPGDAWALAARAATYQEMERFAGRPGAGRVIVLIPAHNEAASISETISSLRRQTRPPDEIIVVSDNSSDATDEQSLRSGAKVLVTAGNTARKAGALNQALRQILPALARDDLVLIMDADSQLAPGWIRGATDALARDSEVGGVSGTYTGEDGPGLLRQLQRNEFVRASRLVRRRADLWVLSGTGTMFRVPVLREVARERGRRLPGAPGEYYDSTSITEDYEITLALKTLGHRCLCPPGCTALTELMPTWRHLFRQRLRWQSGTLSALRRYGFTQVTWTNWVRQAFFYGRYCSQLVCWVVLAGSLIARFGFNMPGWVLGMLLTIYLERVITARGAGRKGVLVAALLFPEWVYGMFDGLYLFQALSHELTSRDVSWNHVVKESAGHAAINRHSVLPAGRPVLVRETGDGQLRDFGDRQADTGQVQAGTGIPSPDPSRGLVRRHHARRTRDSGLRLHRLAGFRPGAPGRGAVAAPSAGRGPAACPDRISPGCV